MPSCVSTARREPCENPRQRPIAVRVSDRYVRAAPGYGKRQAEAHGSKVSRCQFQIPCRLNNTGGGWVRAVDLIAMAKHGRGRTSTFFKRRAV